jgi:predicted HNH restriction endonuclease
VQTYFPRTTISLERNGKIVESDAPNIKLPVRLPGLDVKRFPDITYVPIQFPDREMKTGDTWMFKKKFGESDIDYTCTVGEKKEDAVIINVSIKQEYELLEDAALEVVTEEKNAEHRVKTVMSGSGIVLFDTKRGSVVKAEMVNDAVSDVTKLVDGSKSKRSLRTTFSLSLHVPKPRPVAVQSGSWLVNAWATVQDVSRSALQATLGWWTMAKLAFHARLAKKSLTGG